jgi:hypothetical protein
VLNSAYFDCTQPMHPGLLHLPHLSNCIPAKREAGIVQMRFPY